MLWRDDTQTALDWLKAAAASPPPALSPATAMRAMRVVAAGVLFGVSAAAGASIAMAPMFAGGHVAARFEEASEWLSDEPPAPHAVRTTAVASAVQDALRPLGVEVSELPITPDRIVRWVREARARR